LKKERSFSLAPFQTSWIWKFWSKV